MFEVINPSQSHDWAYIRVNVDYDRIIRGMAPDDVDEMIMDAKQMAYEIYNLRGWKFNTSMLAVSLGCAPAVMAHDDDTPRKWFQFSYVGNNDLDRRRVLATKRTFLKDSPKFLDYHSFDHLRELWQSGRLDEVVLPASVKKAV